MSILEEERKKEGSAPWQQATRVHSTPPMPPPKAIRAASSPSLTPWARALEPHHTVLQQPSRCRRRSSLRKRRKGEKGSKPIDELEKRKRQCRSKKRLRMLPCCRKQQHELFIQHQSLLEALILTLGLLLLLQTVHFPMESYWLLFKFFVKFEA